ncbi:MAG: YhfC family glutamic-type intramembrane protease [Chloroflexota bacterium]
MLGAPVALGLFLWRRWRLPWTLFFAGAVAFVGSQVVHLPLNFGLTALFNLDWMPKPPEAWQLPFNAVVLGLTAGLCEETARYLVYRFWLKEARTWRQALMFGAGHGGVEAMLTGLLVGVTLLNMAAMRGVDVTALGLPAEQAAEAARQVKAFWATPAYMPLLAAAERLMAMLFHLSAAALVMQVFLRGRLWPLWAAIGWHALLNAVAVYINGAWGGKAAEAALAVLSLGSVAILWATRRAERAAGPEP